MRIRIPGSPLEDARRMIELWQRRSQLVEELAEIDKEIEQLGFCGRTERTANTEDGQRSP